MINRWYAIMPRGRFWHLVETKYSDSFINQSHNYNWVERRHQGLWLPESLIGLLRFPESQQTGEKSRIPKFWRVPLPGEQ